MDEEGEVGLDEPGVDLELVRLGPDCEVLEAHALVAQVCELVHEQAVAAGCVDGFDDDDLALGELEGELVARGAGGLVGARDAEGQARMQDVLAALEDGAPRLHVLAHAHLARLDVGAREHLGVEVGRRVGLAEIVLARKVVEVIVEVHIVDVAALKVFLREVAGRAAAQNVISHMTRLSFACTSSSRIPEKRFETAKQTLSAQGPSLQPVQRAHDMIGNGTSWGSLGRDGFNEHG